MYLGQIEGIGQYLKTLLIIQLTKSFLLLIYFTFALNTNPNVFDTFLNQFQSLFLNYLFLGRFLHIGKCLMNKFKRTFRH